MKIIIKSTNLSLSPSIKGRIEEKIGGLDRYLKRIDPETVEARVEVEKTKPGQRHGEVFRAEVNLKVGGRILRTENTEKDLYCAIDLARSELARKLARDRQKQDTIFKRGARSWKKFWQVNPLARFRKSKKTGRFLGK